MEQTFLRLFSARCSGARCCVTRSASATCKPARIFGHVAAVEDVLYFLQFMRTCDCVLRRQCAASRLDVFFWLF